MSADRAIVGVSNHNGWAVLVTVAADGTLLDRRRVELVDAGLPCMPFHNDGQRLPLEQGVALVKRVRASAKRRAKQALEALARDVGSPIVGLALRECPKLPATTAEQIRDYFAQCNADSVMYREALADAAAKRGWSVHWFDRRRVLDAAGEALGIDAVDAYLGRVRQTIGPPWNKDHREAMAAAIAAGASLGAAPKVSA